MTAHVHSPGLEARKSDLVDLEAVAGQDLLPFGHGFEFERHIHFGKALRNGITKEINQHQNPMLHCQRQCDK